MRETMLHFDHALSAEARDQLCRTYGAQGIRCDTAIRSAKPHLMFVAYDESRAAPHDLVHIAAAAGYPAQVVDL